MTFTRWKILAGLKHRGTLTSDRTIFTNAPKPTLLTGATLVVDVAVGPPPSKAAIIDLEPLCGALSNTKESADAETITDAPEIVADAPVPGYSRRGRQ